MPLRFGSLCRRMMFKASQLQNRAEDMKKEMEEGPADPNRKPAE